MNSMIQLILFQAVIAPLEQASFPSGYDFLNGIALEYSVEYQWTDARTVVLTHRAVDGPERQSVLTLGEDFRVLRESAKRGDTLTVSSEYEYSEGKLLRVRTPRTLRTFHYQGERLDSISETSADTLEEYHKYAYDSQDRLIRTDHAYDRMGAVLTMHRSREISYFLPDSIVIVDVYARGPQDSSRATLHLVEGRPVRMVEVEGSGVDRDPSVHIWRYSGLAAVEGRGRRPTPFGIRSWTKADRFDALGRLLPTAPAFGRVGSLPARPHGLGR